MGRMTSYQLKVRQILYYQQCIDELERTCMAMAKMLAKHGECAPFVAMGVEGDKFITPYNSGHFGVRLLHPQ